MCSSAGRSDGGGGRTSHEVQRNTTFLSEVRVFPRENSVIVRWFPSEPDFSLGRVACFQEKTGRSRIIS